ncbi:MAG: hypothetical protein J7598_24650 [Mitsuaria chitosanitabida]|uniref:hypothetical protein n=1 Tax=Roseateles chitosanitabidus TaxID=65048 RepID=UPI001B2A5073|nr:hypothetical protein [Roseateles chitosanitabidus]MBO9689804.1 hypothetical protein [Roseateles chitosanitabidus]
MRHFPPLPQVFHLGHHAAGRHRPTHHGVVFWLSHAALLLALLLIATEVSAQQAGDLKARYEQMAPQLAHSPFQKPIVLSSVDDTQHPTGEMHAVVDHDFGALAGALRDADAWCELLTLPANVKKCVVDDEAQPSTLHMAVGRKFDQPIEDAYALDFRFQVVASRPDYLLVEMSAAKGPMGTSDYRMTLEAIPLDARRSFVRLRYAYANNFAARVATSAYLATTGRGKVGFTIVGHEEDGAPRYVGGIQGIAERNTMRYFLAIESYLDTLPAPQDQRLDKRLRDWFAATERYARQLHEQPLEEYLAMKHKEARRQMAQAAGE